jgi:phage tail-like protein
LLYLDSKPGEAVKRWEIEAAYPIKWNGPQFNSTTNELMVESIEVAFRSFYLTK